MAEKGLSAAELARLVSTDPKSADNWINRGTVPRRETQREIAKRLGCEIRDLWPEQVPLSGTALPELVNLWSHRSDSPKDFWWRLFTTASSRIDLLGYAMQFLHEEHKDFVDLLLDKAQNGCLIRIVVADPNAQVVLNRDKEEELSGGLISRIRTSLTYLRPLMDVLNCELRLQAIPMYNSIFRFDDDMLVTPHLYERPGRLAPLLHIQRKMPRGIFDTYASSFEDVFQDALVAKVGYVST